MKNKPSATYTEMVETLDKARQNQAKVKVQAGGQKAPITLARPQENKSIMPIQAELFLMPKAPEEHRPIPNVLARSAIFGIGNPKKKRRRYSVDDPAIIGSTNNIVITYTGDELWQDDEDVFIQLAYLNRQKPIGQEVQFVARQVLLALGWEPSANNYNRLQLCIERLAGAHIVIRSASGDYGKGGFRLISKFAWYDPKQKKNERVVSVTLDPESYELFGSQQYTLIDWQQRKRLSSDLSKWLHSFYSTHARPLPYYVETLRKMCGSESSKENFVRLLKKSHAELAVVGMLHAQGWTIEGSPAKVYVRRDNRAMTKSQIKFLDSQMLKRVEGS